MFGCRICNYDICMLCDFKFKKKAEDEMASLSNKRRKNSKYREKA